MRTESDEMRALRSFQDALRKAMATGDTVDVERAHQKAGCCSDPRLRLVMSGVIHGAAKLEDALHMVGEDLAHEECA